MTDTIFSYRSGNSIIHKTKGLLKLIFVCVVSVRLFSNTNFGGFSTPLTRLVFYGILSIFFFILAKTPFKHLKKISFIPLIGLAITLMRLVVFFPNENSTENMQKILFFYLDFAGGKEGLLYTARFFISMIFSLVLFETMSFLQLIDAIESLEKIIPPLKKTKLTWIISITINFIPKVFTTWQKTNYAAQARITKKQNIVQKIVYFTMQIFAMLSCLLQLAELTRKAIANRIF
ncbi:MAG: energy-coupling factor transporter transmembrane component T family protein [Treponemataceae bacterium]